MTILRCAACAAAGLCACAAGWATGAGTPATAFTPLVAAVLLAAAVCCVLVAAFAAPLPVVAALLSRRAAGAWEPGSPRTAQRVSNAAARVAAAAAQQMLRQRRTAGSRSGSPVSEPSSPAARLVKARVAKGSGEPPQRPARFDGDSADVVVYQSRNVNANLIVYLARWEDKDRLLLAEKPIDTCWFSIDPEYRARRAARGGAGDRVELNFVERQVFGVQLRRLADSPSLGRCWEVAFVAAKKELGSRRLLLYADPHLRRAVMETELGAARAPAHIERIHSFARKGYTGWAVLTVDAHGAAAASGDAVAERLKGRGAPGAPP